MSAARTWKEEHGTVGFTVHADPAAQLIRMRIWGVWDDGLAERYEASMLSALSMIPEGTKWNVLVDIINFPPQKPSVQEHHANCMRHSTEKIRRAANLVSSSLSQMQIRRLSEESAVPAYSFFTSEADAVRWLKASETDSTREGRRSAR